MSTCKLVFQFDQKHNGKQPPILAWSQDSSYCAIGTSEKLVYIIDKRGKIIAEKQLPAKGKVQMIDWDNENQMLAILVEGQNFVYLWTPLTTNFLQELEFQNNKQKCVWIKWSKSHPVLTVGTEKGYLNFYLKKSKRKIPTMGKHSKRIIGGDWNNQGLVVTGSQDKIITVSNHNSDSACNSLAVKSQPRDLKWMATKNDQRSKKQKTVCAILNKKTLLMHDMFSEGIAPLELQFQQKYGKIIDYQFYGDGYIIVGFSQGYYCSVSTHSKQMKDQIISRRVFNAPLEAMAVSASSNKVCMAGQNKIKTYATSDFRQIKQQTIDLPNGAGKVNKMEFSKDGSLLVISTLNGMVFGYILSTNMLVSNYNQLVAILGSLTEVTILACSSKKKGQAIQNINLDSQPTSITLGPCHLAARQGNIVNFYRWQKQKTLINGGQLVNRIQYEHNIVKLFLNQKWVVIITDKNKVHVNSIEDNKVKQKIFPLQGEKQIQQLFLTKIFLILLDNSSKLKFYHLEDKTVIMEHKPDNPILRMFPNKNGTKIIFQHQNGQVNLFYPNTQTYFHIKTVCDRVDKVIWDTEMSSQFVLINGKSAYSYVISKNNIFSHVVSPVYQILSLDKVDNEQGQPTMTKVEDNVICLSQGNIFHVGGASINYTTLASHAFLQHYNFENDNVQGHSRYFFLNISLRRFHNSLVSCKFLKNNQFCQALGKKSLQNLDLETAMKAFQMGKNLSMVLSLEPLMHQNQKDLLVGHIAMMLGHYDLAQQYYLKSSQPLNALDMRCDIQDWFIASSLTKNIAPQQQNFISKRLAIQTQSQGHNTEALKQFQKSVINGDLKTISKSVVQRHNVQCFAGMARTSIKLGDIQRGFNIARQIKDKMLLTDIAVVCQNMKQSLEAAQLYQKAQMFQKSATLYLNLKMFKQAAPLMKKIKTPSILIKFGKAKQSQGAYKQAEQAYQDAQAWQDVVRVNLNNFDDLQKPKQILRTKCSTSTVALMVANYCEKRGYWKQAVQFSIMANRKQEAFVMAQTHGQMDTYADCLKQCTPQQRNQIAQYYQGKAMWDKAAKQYEQAKNPLKALKLWIKSGQLFIPNMIELIEKNSTQEHLIQELLDYLMGEADGQPKDPIHTYRLYRILKNFKNAAKIAVTIASQEQETGNYKAAHQILFQSYQDIKKANAPVPLQLEKKLSILHSYIIAIKRVAKMDQHIDTALLLHKVAKNIIQFPAHASSILTTTVVKSMRAELKGLAYTWAIVVFRPEYKDQIPQKYVQKIKKVAMKPVNQEIPQPKSPCPFCKEPVPDYSDDCSKCLNFIPFCIASGKHVVGDDLAVCSHCKFPCNYSYMKRMLQSPEVEKTCPMCNCDITIDDITFLGQKGVSALKKVFPKEEQKEKKKQ